MYLNSCLYVCKILKSYSTRGSNVVAITRKLKHTHKVLGSNHSVASVRPKSIYFACYHSEHRIVDNVPQLRITFGSAAPPDPDSITLTVRSASIPAILLSIHVYTVLPTGPSILLVKIQSTAALASGPY